MAEKSARFEDLSPRLLWGMSLPDDPAWIQRAVRPTLSGWDRLDVERRALDPEGLSLPGRTPDEGPNPRHTHARMRSPTASRSWPTTQRSSRVSPAMGGGGTPSDRSMEPSPYDDAGSRPRGRRTGPRGLSQVPPSTKAIRPAPVQANAPMADGAGASTKLKTEKVSAGMEDTKPKQ